ncbi:MAG TPA: hypothetical protein VNJ05_11135 [Sphingomicrobium sp.]|nr:hypothetical protein [Sphingomicrobium sp.]
MLWPALLLAALGAPDGGEPVAEEVSLYGEMRGYCMAFFRSKERQFVIRLSAKTNDDGIVFWQTGLPSLTSGMNKLEREAASVRHYDLQLLVGGIPVPLTSQTGPLDAKQMPGHSYTIGVDDQQLIKALANSPDVEVRLRGKLLTNLRVANNAGLASKLASCVASN